MRLDRMGIPTSSSKATRLERCQAASIGTWPMGCRQLWSRVLTLLHSGTIEPRVFEFRPGGVVAPGKS